MIDFWDLFRSEVGKIIAHGTDKDLYDAYQQRRLAGMKGDRIKRMEMDALQKEMTKRTSLKYPDFSPLDLPHKEGGWYINEKN